MAPPSREDIAPQILVFFEPEACTDDGNSQSRVTVELKKPLH